MSKHYRVQDLASYGRKVTVAGQDVQFDGHYATVSESLIAYFNQVDDFQVGTPIDIPDVQPETPEVPEVPEIPEEEVSIPKASLPEVPEPVSSTPFQKERVVGAETQTTTSPNLQTIITPRDDTPKPEPVTVGEVIKPRIAQE